MKNILTEEWESEYSFHVDLQHISDLTQNVVLNKLEVLDWYDRGHISVSDLYIVYAVSMLTFANTYQIIDYITLWKEHNKDIPIPSTMDKDSIVSRLKTLCGGSFLRRHKFTNINGEPRDYFYTTPHGNNFLKKLLYFKGNYDEYLGAIHIQEVLKYLSINQISLKVIESIAAKYPIEVSSKPFFTTHSLYFDKATRSTVEIYGFFNLKDRNKRILLEPFRMKYDELCYSKNQMVTLAEERFEFLKRYISDFVRDNSGSESLNVVFVCENLASIKILAKQISKWDEYFYSYVSFTTDKLIRDKGLENSSFKVKLDDGKVKLVIGSL